MTPSATIIVSTAGNFKPGCARDRAEHASRRKKCGKPLRDRSAGVQRLLQQRGGCRLPERELASGHEIHSAQEEWRRGCRSIIAGIAIACVLREYLVRELRRRLAYLPDRTEMGVEPEAEESGRWRLPLPGVTGVATGCAGTTRQRTSATGGGRDDPNPYCARAGSRRTIPDRAGRRPPGLGGPGDGQAAAHLQPDPHEASLAGKAEDPDGGLAFDFLRPRPRHGRYGPDPDGATTG